MTEFFQNQEIKQNNKKKTKIVHIGKTEQSRVFFFPVVYFVRQDVVCKISAVSSGCKLCTVCTMLFNGFGLCGQSAYWTQGKGLLIVLKTLIPSTTIGTGEDVVYLSIRLHTRFLI